MRPIARIKLRALFVAGDALGPIRCSGRLASTGFPNDDLRLPSDGPARWKGIVLPSNFLQTLDALVVSPSQKKNRYRPNQNLRASALRIFHRFSTC
jgi:hypothetical protein